jgi:hypothetical protein
VVATEQKRSPCSLFPTLADTGPTRTEPPQHPLAIITLFVVTDARRIELPRLLEHVGNEIGSTTQALEEIAGGCEALVKHDLGSSEVGGFLPTR